MNILWLKTGPLHPLDSGGKLRTYNMLRQLRRNHQVTYLSHFPEGTDESTQTQASEYSSHHIWVRWREASKGSPAFAWQLLRNLLFSSRPYIIDKYFSASYVDALRHQLDCGGYDLVICDFPAPSLNLLRVGRESTKIPTILFQHNVEAMIWKRLAEAAGNPLKKAYFENQWQRMVRYERKICEFCDGVIAVSPEDAQTMRNEYGLSNVLGDVPTGVDSDQFQQVRRERLPGNIVFLGSMDWMPNIDAVQWFVQQIYPLVCERLPNATLSIVGRRPDPSVLALGKADATIKVTGTVPDVRPYLAEGSVCVVPLRAGGGTRIKIFEAMAAGIPVVSTRIGAEGLPVEDGTHCFLADDPRAFANRVIDVLQGAPATGQMAATAAKLVREKFDWEHVTSIFEKLCQEVLP
ncbi:MAG: glycosyltransferase [Victivallales bacterium]|nr:glycosyltransferase [Victivallales bacterium]MBT7166594.1 glycosyltransferase [Victivallales bacterium]